MPRRRDERREVAENLDGLEHEVRASASRTAQSVREPAVGALRETLKFQQVEALKALATSSNAKVLTLGDGKNRSDARRRSRHRPAPGFLTTAAARTNRGRMDLYFVKVSGNSLRALFGLEEVGAPYTPHLLDLTSGENTRPDYLAINPMGKVPTLVDGDLTLWESNAILFYLAEKFPERRLFPSDTRARADVLRWIFFNTAHFSPGAAKIFFPKVQHLLFGRPLDPRSIEDGEKELARFAPVLDAHLAGREWISGEFSIADISYGPTLSNLKRFRDQAFAPWRNIEAYASRLLSRPAWGRASELSLQGQRSTAR